MKGHQRFPGIPTREPHCGSGHTSRRHVQMKTNRRIYGALGNGVARKMPLLCITPSAFGIANTLCPRCEVFDAVAQRIFAHHQKPTLVFVMDDALKLWIEVCGVTNRRRIN